ncbi:hypothetical protein JXA27_06570 [Aerococcaceae bacterium zg-B36]|uniref:hypothetical protein n=1 Tax=Aerococcaceae bacterium zg-252 TaxID=2796928 RepID=UPI001BD82F2C|nr:hypothetical protein [Aerococcaceae bacterium zg-B36]
MEFEELIRGFVNEIKNVNHDIVVVAHCTGRYLLIRLEHDYHKVVGKELLIAVIKINLITGRKKVLSASDLNYNKMSREKLQELMIVARSIEVPFGKKQMYFYNIY